jgi:hypothetical protein
MAIPKCSVNDSIKSEYPFIKGVNENVERTLRNAKFFITHCGRSDVVNHVTSVMSRFFLPNVQVFRGKMEVSGFLKRILWES